MSTYGGDSWVPESMRRKQQVEQVLHDVHLMDRYSHQWCRLSNGRIACLVCPHRPVLDTFPMLIMHRKGEKHQAAAAKQEESDFCLQNEIQKRTALEAVKAPEIVKKKPPTSSPLLEATRKRTAQALATVPDDSSTGSVPVVPYTKQKSTLFFSATSSQVAIQPIKVEKASDPGKRKKGRRESEPKAVPKEDQEQRHERERLLRLREAGWRLDGKGKWSKDESVEFDSDEETPADLL